MSDNIQLPNSQITTASDDVGGVQFQRVKFALGADGVHDGDVSAANPLPVKLDTASLAALENISVTVENPSNSGLTDTQLRAAPVQVSQQSQPLPTGASTEATLAALKTVVDNLKTVVDTLNAKVTQVNTGSIAGEVSLSAPTLAALENTTVTIADVATDTTLNSVNTSINNLKTVVDALNAKVTQVNTGSVTITNPTPQGLTNTELRASPITVSVNNQSALTDTQLRASPIPTSDLTLQNFQLQLIELSSTLTDMSDSMLYMLSSILEKMARVDRFDRMAVQVSDNSGNELNSPYYGVSSNTVGESTTGRSISRINEPFNFANMGANHLYNQLTITN